MKKLRVFDTQEQFENVKCNLEKSVCKVKESESIFLKKDNYFIAYYDVKSISDSTKLLGFDLSNITQISSMYIDDVKVTPMTEYTFSNIGIHKVKCEINSCTFTTCYKMFNDCKNLIDINLNNLDTSKVTNMSNMFYGCYGLEIIDLSSIDTSNVTNMSAMFGTCINLKDIITDNIDTSKVTNMSGMFGHCYSLTSLSLTNFDTSSLESIDVMFYECLRLTYLNLSTFNLSKVTNMRSIFAEPNANVLLVIDCEYLDKWNEITIPITWDVQCE